MFRLKKRINCALVTVDSTGQPHVRTMDLFPPEKDMVVWFGASNKSRKVQEIRNYPKVKLYYSDPEDIEVISYKNDLVVDPETWRTPYA